MMRGSFVASLRVSRRDLLWLPGSMLALFALIAALMSGEPRQPDTVKGFLGVVVPLLGGILAAYAVLDDPALELLFASPLTAARLLFRKLAGPALVTAVTALAYMAVMTGLGFDWRAAGGLAEAFWSWVVPSAGLVALGCAASLAAGQCAGGALAVGLVWIVELVARGWFLRRDAASLIFLFMGTFSPADPRLLANRLCLASASAALLAAAWGLLLHRERYL